jgi:HSP20 family molecular chaperone IbpA
VANQKRSWAIAAGDFERTCDELFDELLGSWRRGTAPGVAPMVAVDRGGHYEVRIAADVADPRTLVVEVTGATLRVRVPEGALPPIEHSVSFAHPVDRERTTARWARGVLTITVPKQRGRRVKIE